jgi:hypothetical protein
MDEESAPAMAVRRAIGEGRQPRRCQPGVEPGRHQPGNEGAHHVQGPAALVERSSRRGDVERQHASAAGQQPVAQLRPVPRVRGRSAEALVRRPRRIEVGARAKRRVCQNRALSSVVCTSARRARGCAGAASACAMRPSASSRACSSAASQSKRAAAVSAVNGRERDCTNTLYTGTGAAWNWETATRCVASQARMRRRAACGSVAGSTSGAGTPPSQRRRTASRSSSSSVARDSASCISPNAATPDVLLQCKRLRATAPAARTAHARTPRAGARRAPWRRRLP